MATPSNEHEIRTQLDRILASDAFRNAKSLTLFLRYVVHKALDGGGDQIKEYVLGAEVFERGENFDSRTDPIVRVQAVKLRAKLARYYQAEGRNDRLLITLPKGGYVPAFEYRAIAAELSRPATTPLKRLPKRAVLAAGGLFTAMLLAAALYLYSAKAKPRPSITSLAVLPFVNMTGDPGKEYLSDGLTEEILDRLAQIEGLRVPARTSSFQFKNKAVDIGEIGRKLRVSTVLEGSVRMSGTRIRITSQLNRTSDGYHMWSRSFEWDVKDPLAAEEELARVIVQELHLDRNSPAAVRAASRSPKPEAYNRYLQARYFWNKRTADGFHTAIRYFEEAVSLDPSYSRAWAGLSDSYALLSINGYAAARDVLPKARSAAEKALALDDSLGDAHAALAIVLDATHDPARAEAEIRRAIGLSPNYASAHQWYSRILGNERRYEEATREILTAEDLDPVSPILYHAHGILLNQMGRREDAVAQFQRALALDPGFTVSNELLAMAYLRQGSCEEAIAIQEKVAAGGELRRRATLGEILAKCRRTIEAQRILDEVREKAARQYVAPLSVVRLAIALGRNDVALDGLERAYDEGENWIWNLKSNPTMAPLRAQPRFQNLLKRIAERSR